MWKKDIPFAAFIGFLTALLLSLVLKQSGLRFPYGYALLALLTFPILSVTTMWLASRTAYESIYQATKFVLVGTLNTFMDWGVLNLLLMVLSVTHGPLYPICKGSSFVVALTNSYFWNKFWTFKNNRREEKKRNRTELLQFFLVSVIGFTLNVTVANIIVNSWGPQFQMSAPLWATVGASGGSLIGITWNFIGYRLIVFNPKKEAIHPLTQSP